MSKKTKPTVIPPQAGIQSATASFFYYTLDSRLHGNDERSAGRRR